MTERKNFQLFPDAETLSAPIFMTLPALGSSKSELDAEPVRAVTADAMPVTQPRQLTGDQSKFGLGFTSTGADSWVNPVPQPLPGPLPKKIDAFSNMRSLLVTLPQLQAKSELPVLPPHVERFTSFVSTKDASSIMQSVIGHLTRIKIDYQYTPTRHKLSGVGYDNQTPFNFKVKIFQHRSDTNRTVCEVQRRSGDVVAFSNFYNALIRALGSDIVEKSYVQDLLASNNNSGISGSTSSTSTGSKTLGTLPLPSFSLAPVSFSGASVGPGQVILDESTTRSLLDISSCREIDVSRESMRALSNLSSVPQNSAKLVGANTSAAGHSRSGSSTQQHENSAKDTPTRVINLISEKLVGKDLESVRCAATLLSNIVSQVSIHPQLVTLVPAMVSLVAASGPSAGSPASAVLASREIKRQVARALLSLLATQVKALDSSLKVSFVKTVKTALLGTTDDELKPLLMGSLLALEGRGASA